MLPMPLFSRGRLVELLDQRADERQARRVRGAHDQRVAARVDQDHRARRRRAPRPAARPTSARRWTSGARSAPPRSCSGITSTSPDVGVSIAAMILRDALQVVGVVGDDERVVAGVGVDRVVRADQRAQHRHQVVRVLVGEAEDLRDDLVALARRRLGRDDAGLQLGVGLGHDLEQAADLDHREAEAAQRGQVVQVGLARRHRLLAVQRDVALDARVDDELLASGSRPPRASRPRCRR